MKYTFAEKGRHADYDVAFYKGCGYNDSSYAMQQFMKDDVPPPI